MVRDKEIWTRQTVPEKYVGRVPVTKYRRVKVPKTTWKRITVTEEVAIPTNKLVEVDAFRIDEVEDSKLVEVEELQDYELRPVATGPAQLRKTTDLGALKHKHLTRTRGHEILELNDPRLSKLHDEDDAEMMWREAHPDDVRKHIFDYTRDDGEEDDEDDADKEKRRHRKWKQYNNKSNNNNDGSGGSGGVYDGKHYSKRGGGMLKRSGGNGVGQRDNSNNNYNNNNNNNHQQQQQSRSVSFGSGVAGSQNDGGDDDGYDAYRNSLSSSAGGGGGGMGFAVKSTHGHGLLVSSVDPYSLANDSGVCQGDLITVVNHEPVYSIQQFRRLCKQTSGRLELQVRRANGDKAMLHLDR
jgi:hypothetical protein